MKKIDMGLVVFFLFAVQGIWMGSHTFLGSAGDSAFAQANDKSKSGEYLFFSNRKDIIEAAKKEGRLQVFSGLDSGTIGPMIAAFKKKFPFIEEVETAELTNVDAHQRFLLELKSGSATEWDVVSIANDLYGQYPPHLMKVDILGMTKRGVLQVPLKMIDPVNRNVVAMTANVQVGVGYNRNLIKEEDTPNSWEDYLKPQFKGRKFLIDVRPTEIAALVPAWGLEKTLKYARGLSSQEPVWVRGGTRGLLAVISGEVPMFIGTNYKTIRRAERKDPTKSLRYKFLEPVPVRPSESLGIIGTSKNAHAALLWLEFQASAEGQAIIDKYEPFGASIHGPGSLQGQEIRGKELSVVDWDHYMKLGDYQKKVVEALGFPTAEIRK